MILLGCIHVLLLGSLFSWRDARTEVFNVPEESGGRVFKTIFLAAEDTLLICKEH